MPIASAAVERYGETVLCTWNAHLSVLDFILSSPRVSFGFYLLYLPVWIGRYLLSERAVLLQAQRSLPLPPWLRRHPSRV